MLAAFVAVTVLAAAPAPSLVDCPRTLAVEQKAVSLPVGWSAADEGSPHRLIGVTFFDGPPAELASLVYDETAPADKEWIGIWHFEPNPRGFWIACSFGGTSVVLSRRLPAEVRACRVTYAQKRGEGPVGDIGKIDCR